MDTVIRTGGYICCMNQEQAKKKTEEAVRKQIRERGYAAPADVLMDIGVLSKRDYLSWRNGSVPYLEKVCTCSLNRLSFIMHVIRSLAAKNGYKPSLTYYKQWGARKNGHRTAVQLRFSKSGAADIERNYATHYIDSRQIEYLKKKKEEGIRNEEDQTTGDPLRKRSEDDRTEENR